MWYRPVLIETADDTALKFICGMCNIKYDSLSISPDKQNIGFYMYDQSGDPRRASLARYSVETGGLTIVKPADVLPLALDNDVSFRVHSPIIWLGDSISIYGAASSQSSDNLLVYNSDRVGIKRRDWYRIDNDGRSVNLTSQIATDPGHPIAADRTGLYFWDRKTVLKVSPDGRVSKVRSTPGNNGGILTDETLDYVNIGIEPVPEKAVSFFRNSEGWLYSLNLRSGSLAKISNVPSEYEAALISADYSLILWKNERNGPSQYALTKINDSQAHGFTPLLAINTRLSMISKPQQRIIEYRDPEGQLGKACLLLPEKAGATEALPTIVDVYPYSGSGSCPNWSSRNWVNPLMYISQGYAYLHIPVRQPVRSPITKQFTDYSEWVDPVLDAVVAQGYADPRKLVLQGISQGSFVALNLISKTNRFCSAIIAHGAANFASFWGERDFGNMLVYGDRYPPLDNVLRFQDPANPLWLGAEPWEDPESYVRISPLFSANKILTPILFIHTDLDGFSLSHFQQLYAALYRQDKKSSFVYYIGETHGLDSPANIIDVHQRVSDWISCPAVQRLL